MPDCETNLRERILELMDMIEQDSKTFASIGLTNFVSGELNQTDLQCAIAFYANLSKAEELLKFYNQNVDDPDMKTMEKLKILDYEQAREQIETYFRLLTRVVNRA